MNTATMEQQTVPVTGPAAIAVEDNGALPTALPVKRRVVVLGGGVAGLTAAHELRHRLDKKTTEVLLISATEQFSLGPALQGVPFGKRLKSTGFAIAPSLEKKGIGFLHASVEHVDPQRRLLRAAEQEIPYDYLFIATGPAVDGVTVPGVQGQFNASYSLHTDLAAMETGQALEDFLAHPGPAVVGLAPGAAYLSAAYEFALQLDYALRSRSTRDRATLTFVTPENYLGHLGLGTAGAQRRLERLFAKRQITALTGTDIARVDRQHVYLRGGRTLPSVFTMVMPAFHGVPDIWKSAGLTDAHGYVPVDEHYRHQTYSEIFAAGVAAQADVPAPSAGGLPKTGYLSARMARIAARNMAAVITWALPNERSLPRLLDLRILDGGDCGLLLISTTLFRPVRLALPLPGRSAHWAKGMLSRYLLWKLRTGR